MNKFKFAQDAVFFITVGFVWVVLILSIALFFLPYYLLNLSQHYRPKTMAIAQLLSIYC